jgi:hypothetical protein
LIKNFWRLQALLVTLCLDDLVAASESSEAAIACSDSSNDSSLASTAAPTSRGTRKGKNPQDIQPTDYRDIPPPPSPPQV